MYNPDDDIELDRLSREAAAGYEVPGNANWESMRQMLDKELPVAKKKRRFIILWWLLPVLLTGGTYYWMNEHKPSSGIKPSTTANQAVSPSADKAVVSDAAAAPASSADKLQESNVLENHTSKSNLDKQSLRKTDKSNKINTPVKQLIRKTSSSNTASSTNQPSLLANNEINKATIQTSIPKPASANEEIANPAAATTTNTNSANSTNGNDQAVVKPVALNNPTDSSVKQENTMTVAVKKQHGWSIGILGGIDKSTVKFRYGYEPGYNVGILAGYHFSPAISLHTGAIYTQKNYKMYGSDFTAPKGSMVSYYKLETVDGYCRMWEVPLLLRYTIHKNKQKAIYFNTGLSSYFMTNENYNYAYHYNGMPVVRNSDYNSTDTHLLSIVDLSVGFEKKIGKQLFMQIEPYGKIPLGGVGYGSILLSSFGVNVSFALQHFSNKK